MKTLENQILDMEEYHEFIVKIAKTAEPMLCSVLEFYGAPVIRTVYSHSQYDETKIDGTQKKGLFLDINDDMELSLLKSRVYFVVESIISSAKKEVIRCDGCNGYLLNYFEFTFLPKSNQKPERLKIITRGCPTIVPDGFDFKRAGLELTAVPMPSQAYGYDLLCHPKMVREVADPS